MPQCGKTPLVKGLVKNQYLTDFKKLVGVGILTRDVTLSNGEVVGISIWDISEEERFNMIKQKFYQGGAGAILVFDISRIETWEAIKNHKTIVYGKGRMVPFMLLGNKLEKLDGVETRPISSEECKQWAEELGGFYVETRSDDYPNVDAALIKLTNIVMKSRNLQ